MKTNKYLVSVLVADKKYKSFSVPEEVYIYVKQLESCIRNPKDSRLLEVYSERFASVLRSKESKFEDKD